MCLRPRVEKDLPAVEALLRHARLSAEQLASTRGWVAEHEGRVTGHVALDESSDGVVLRSLVVDPAHRGTGLGRALLDRAEAEAGTKPRFAKSESIGTWLLARGWRPARLEEIPEGVRAAEAMGGKVCACSAVFVAGLAESAPAPVAPKPSFLARGGWLLGALPLWGLLYAVNHRVSEWIAFGLLGLAPKSHLGESVAFFFYDVPKVLLLLSLVVFVVSFLQTFVSPTRVRDALARRAAGTGNALASLFGIITPFCSCSAVPLFIGFLRAGVPLGVTFSFLVAAPMINEVALGMLFALFGWKVALLYAGTGVAIAFLSGLLLGRMRMERHLEGWVQDALKAPALGEGEEARPDTAARLDAAVGGVKDIVGKVWPYILVGILVGAFIHGYVPEALMASLLGRQAWYSVPLAVLIGVPLYSNAAGVLPIVEALLGKGAALGSTLAFMMAVIGLSLPETVILRRVMRPRLIAAFVGVVATGILLVGYLFNLIL